MSNLGRWATWYEGLTDPAPYGGTRSYELAEEHLKGLGVEDWGCGKGWFRQVHRGPYLGVDGTESPMADVVADLRDYRSTCGAVLLRHVIEHDYGWADIVANAVASASRKVVIILFTPSPDEGVVEHGFTPEIGVPDLGISLDLIAQAGRPFEVTSTVDIESDTQYGTERIIVLEPS